LPAADATRLPPADDKPANMTAEQAFALQGGIEAPQRKRCVDWLKEILSEVDSMPSKEILEMAKEEGFKETTLAKARKELGVKCFPDFDEEGSRFWSWKLPKTNENEKKLPSLEETLKKLQKMKEKTKLFPLKSSTQ
jgi:hypothetical protein